MGRAATRRTWATLVAASAVAACSFGLDRSLIDAEGSGGNSSRGRGGDGGDPDGPDTSDGGVTAEPTCHDGVKNGTETDIDCGGSCPACLEVFEATADRTITTGMRTYQRFRIAPGVVVTAAGDQPLVIEVIGDVTIEGTLNADGTSSKLFLPDGGVLAEIGRGVAGGTNGGACGVPTGAAGAGVGAGTGGTSPKPEGGGWGASGGGGGHGSAGQPGATTPAHANLVAGNGGAAYGTPTLGELDAGTALALVGGSGGGGAGAYTYCTAPGVFADTPGSAGGGGGGVIVLTSRTAITIAAAGTVSARGGASAPTLYPAGTGGGGSGGIVWLRAPKLTHHGTITAAGGVAGVAGQATALPPGQIDGGIGTGGWRGGAGASGRIRLDYATRAGAGTVTPIEGHQGGYP